MGTFGGTYEVGTISVVHGSASVAGVGVVWADIEEGDWITDNTTGIGVVDAVTGIGLDGITLKTTWKGSTLVNATYQIVKMSWLRYEPAITQQKLRQLLVLLQSETIIYYVSGASPDPTVGEEGQLAIKVTGGRWLLWLYTGGVWIAQGTAAGVNYRGAWNSGTTYSTVDVVTRLGNAYIASQTSLNKPP